MDLLTVAICAVQLGVTEGAIVLTAEYAKTREQFDRPIGSFQAVAQRLADGYIDTRFLSLTVWQAAWRLQERLPAAEAIATAKLWAADAGHRVAHTTVHIHGGVGVDLDGEAHRYFTAATRYESEFSGGTTEQALRLGRLLAVRTGVTIRDLLLARAGQDTPALLTHEHSWTWRELVADASARAAAVARLLEPERPPHVGLLMDNTARDAPRPGRCRDGRACRGRGEQHPPR